MKRNFAFLLVLALAAFLCMAAAHADEAADAITTVLEQGTERMEAQDFSGALAHYDAAIAEQGDIAEFHFYRGLALSYLFRYEEAEQAFGKAIEIEPENARYWNEYGMTMLFAGKIQEAYEPVVQAVTLEPLNGEYIGDYGFLLYLLNRHDEAAVELRRAIDLAPYYDNSYYFAAFVQYALGAYEEAIQYCEAYLSKVLVADEMRLLIGDAQFELGRFTEAVAAYNQAIAGGSLTAEDIVNYADAADRAEKPPALQTYNINKEAIPSIDSVVGFRVISSTEAGFSVSLGGSFVKVHYQSGSVLADLQAYADALLDKGWAAIMPEGDDSGDTFRFAAESAADGKLLVVTCQYNENTYTILSHHTGGTLRRFTDGDGNKMGEILPN